MKCLEKIQEKLFNDFLDKDLTVILEGSITTDFIIRGAKIAISDKTLMITDGNKKELIICLDEVTNMYIRSYLEIELEEQKITIDY